MNFCESFKKMRILIYFLLFLFITSSSISFSQVPLVRKEHWCETCKEIREFDYCPEKAGGHKNLSSAWACLQIIYRNSKGKTSSRPGGEYERSEKKFTPALFACIRCGIKWLEPGVDANFIKGAAVKTIKDHPGKCPKCGTYLEVICSDPETYSNLREMQRVEQYPTKIESGEVYKPQKEQAQEEGN